LVDWLDGAGLSFLVDTEASVPEFWAGAQFGLDSWRRDCMEEERKRKVDLVEAMWTDGNDLADAIRTFAAHGLSLSDLDLLLSGEEDSHQNGEGIDLG
jgi:hypothetical protein